MRCIQWQKNGQHEQIQQTASRVVLLNWRLAIMNNGVIIHPTPNVAGLKFGTIKSASS